VARSGIENELFSDHTDIRPTMLALLGMTDDYIHDGRVLIEKFDEKARKNAIRNAQESYTKLAAVYKQINAPVGAFGLGTLGLASSAIASDSAYQRWLPFIADLGARRNALVSFLVDSYRRKVLRQFRT
jgi:hypothetical protein